MKFINTINFTNQIAGFYIDPFEMDSPADSAGLHKFLNRFYLPGQPIFYLCHQQEPATLESAIAFDLPFLPDTLLSPITSLDKIKGYCLSSPYHPQASINLITYLWKRCSELRFFSPADDLTWSSFVSYQASLLQPDPDALKMFTFDFSSCIFLKGAAGESLSINYKKEVNLPKVKDFFTN